MSNASMPNEKFFGVVKNLELQRGFFFIQTHYTGESSDIFCHVSQLLPGYPTPKVADRAMFKLSIDSRTGRQMAIEIEIYPAVPVAPKTGA